MPKILNKASVKTQLSVDFPKQDDRIVSAQYTLRLSAPHDGKNVEIAIDDGPWQPCRQAAGYWWYDWSGYGSGEHEAVARVEMPDGEHVSSEPHEFFVQL